MDVRSLAFGDFNLNNIIDDGHEFKSQCRIFLDYFRFYMFIYFW